MDLCRPPEVGLPRKPEPPKTKLEPASLGALYDSRGAVHDERPLAPLAPKPLDVNLSIDMQVSYGPQQFTTHYIVRICR